MSRVDSPVQEAQRLNDSTRAVIHASRFALSQTDGTSEIEIHERFHEGLDRDIERSIQDEKRRNGRLIETVINQVYIASPDAHFEEEDLGYDYIFGTGKYRTYRGADGKPQATKRAKYYGKDVPDRSLLTIDGLRAPIVQSGVVWASEGDMFIHRDIMLPIDEVRFTKRKRPDALHPFAIIGSSLRDDGDADVLLAPFGQWGSKGIYEYIPIVATVPRKEWVEVSAERQQRLEFPELPKDLSDKIAITASTPGSIVAAPRLKEVNRFGRAGVVDGKQHFLHFKDVKSLPSLDLSDAEMERYGVVDHLITLAIGLDATDKLEQAIEG